jgi:GNAT superfamily N-acetyltransferase
MSNFTIKLLSKDEFMPLYNKYKWDIFESDHSYVLWDLLGEDELSQIKKLNRNLGDYFTLYLAAYDEQDNFAGWSWGFQDHNSDFYMCNSAVLPNYRRQSVYTKLLDECLNRLRKEGFQMVYSRHCATNNSVIIPKLKAGFVISKMEMDDKFGVLVHLHYYFNEMRRKIMDYRSGLLRPDEDLRKLFKME